MNKWWQRILRGTSILPALVLGLFSGRVLSEQLALVPSLAVGITLLTLLLSWFLLQKVPFRQSAPLLWLVGYVVYPEQSPTFIGVVLGLTLLTLIQQQVMPHFKLPTPQWVAVGIFLVASGLYILTLAPGVLPADSGEFQLVATELGVAHPPGFALYTIVAHLMTRLSFLGSPAYTVNLLSALLSAGTLSLLYLTLWQLTRKHIAGMVGVLALGSATTFWAQATTANIRSFTTLWAMGALYALVSACLEGRKSASNRHLWLFALAMSAGITHHASLIFMGVVWGVAMLIWYRGQLKQWRTWGQLLLVGSVGLLPLLYLPIRGAMNAYGAPPDLNTWQGFWFHVLAKGFAGDFFAFLDPDFLGARWRIMGNVFTFQFHEWVLYSSVLGFALLVYYKRGLAVVLGLSLVVHTFITATYRAPQSVEYLMPVYPMVALGVGYLASMLTKNVVVRPYVVSVLAMLTLLQGWQHGYSFVHYQDDTARVTESWLRQAPPDAVLLANWHWATPLWYQQKVAGIRPDVNVRYVAPRGDAYGLTWVEEIQTALNEQKEVIVTNFFADAYGILPTPEPFAEELFLYRQSLRSEMPADFTPMPLALSEDSQLLGYQLNSTNPMIGEEIVLTVAWQATTTLPIPFYIHLVAPDGQLVGQADVTIVPQAQGVTISRFSLTARPGTLPAEHRLMIGVANSDKGRQVVTSMTLKPSSHKPFTQHPVYRPVPSDNSHLSLVGYDWDMTLPNERPRLYMHWQTESGYLTEVWSDESSPIEGAFRCYRAWHWLATCDISPPAYEQYIPFGQGVVWTGSNSLANPQPDQLLTFTQQFHSSQPLYRDWVVSLRLVGYEADGFHWAWQDLDDWVPALGAIPTLKWIAGTHVMDRHLVNVSSDAIENQEVEGLLRLYDAFTQQPLPILDDRLTTVWVPLGRTTIQKEVGR